MPLLTATDESDPRVADYRNVPDAVLLERGGLFVAEGRLVVRRLLTHSTMQTRSVMVTEPGLAAIADVLAGRSDVPVYVVPQAVMNGITGFNMHRGCLALGVRPPAIRLTDLASGARRLIVLERVANADNVGGVFRNAAAFAADGVVLDSRSTDPLYRKSIRTSVGAALSVPFTRTDEWPDAIDVLRAQGITVVALTPASDATPLQDVTAEVGRSRIALLLGHEGEGLTEGALARADHRVRIPMSGEMDSLNVATAAAIALYEFARCSM